MKKITAALCAVMLCVSLIGCGNVSGPITTEAASTTEIPTTATTEAASTTEIPTTATTEAASTTEIPTTTTTEAPATTAPVTTTEAVTTVPAVTTTTPTVGNGHIVCIDAGHQQHGISETEPNGPGSSTMKAKLTTGTQGCVTGVPEYQLNLDVSIKLQAELMARGYTVVMIRTTNDCPLSNAERAQVANSSGSEIFLRIHANSLDNPDVTGCVTFAPSASNPYMTASVINESNRLSQVILDAFCAATGARNAGLQQTDTMTGINWCQIPVTIIEMGFMSNPTEDALMQDAVYQQKMVSGMANGVDAFFGR